MGGLIIMWKHQLKIQKTMRYGTVCENPVRYGWGMCNERTGGAEKKGRMRANVDQE